MLRYSFVIASLLGLCACQADDLEIEIRASELLAAETGTASRIEFEAEAGEEFTEVDDEKRADIDLIVDAIRNYFPDAEVEVDYSGNGYSIEIEGEITISNSSSGVKEPWFVNVSEGPIENSLLVSLETTDSFDSFSRALNSVNLMLSPDEFQPVEFKIRGDGESVLAFGGLLNGEPTTIGISTLSDEWTRIDLSGGVWEDTSAGFLLLR